MGSIIELFGFLWLMGVYVYIGVCVLMLIVLVAIIAVVQFTHGYKRKDTVQ
jgi:hypothetical protein